MPSTWDANANTNLLISINEILDPKPPNWKEVADKMKAKGYDGFTHEACRQHYQKLRKDAKKASGEDSTQSTPAKKATPGKAKGGKKANASLNGSAGDDDESFATPTPKKRKRAGTMKKENVDKSDEGSAYGYAIPGPNFKTEETGDSKDDGDDGLDAEALYDF